MIRTLNDASPVRPAAPEAPPDPAPAGAGRASVTRVTRGRFLAAAGGGLGAVALAACGAPAGAPAGGPAQPAQPVSVEYWSTLPTTHPEGKGRMEAMKLSEAANAEHVKVRYEQDGGTNWEKIVAALTAGSPPDLLVFRPNNAAALADMGAGADVESELKTQAQWAKTRPQVSQTLLDGITWRGKLVGLPLYTVNLAMMYAPEHLEKAGVPAPAATWTWNDFESIAKRAARPPDVWGLDLAWDTTNWQIWAGSNGARFINKEQTKISYTQPESLNAVEFLSKLTHGLGLVPLEPAGELLVKGQTVFERQGPYRMPVLREAGVRFEPLLMPRGPDRPTPYNLASMYSFLFFKSADPARRKAALQVALGCLADEPQTAMCRIHLGMPVSRGAQQSAGFQQYLAQDRQMKTFAEMMPSVDVYPAVPSLEQMWTLRTDAMVKVFKRQDNARNAMLDCEQQTQRLLDQDLAAKK
ncbi:MAG TPA: extracellular solute-binding protein [Chloroflexota bacterium]|nr:extracellular solute-binding protein [Chloroflexota bacterium]